MSNYSFYLKLLSDSTFGRGDGIAGIIDQEVEHDSDGFPFLRGRTLKGLLREECDNLVDVLPQSQKDFWQDSLKLLFGVPGSDLKVIGKMQVGDAQLPVDLRRAVAIQIQKKELTTSEVLNSLTTLRRQTAIDIETGVASDNSLRTNRVILRELVFAASLDLDVDQDCLEDSLSLLSAGAQALRRVGSGRNRGKGHVKCWIQTEAETLNYSDLFFDRIREIGAA
ncbi:ramp superfamily protein probably involved in dna repair [Leptolyngbya sp. Heron Island J]|uniref:RAMP superfamily CRISPR-associated protein n=1 Tax=Leptolyngbya sp. Heron Island J TaxID=1385935 RepID=UPI0003B9D866|nr:RAMP superfamily CRISPR-associated protein [Leptolyngbya sp. Heron Island J]ESA32289.1 ramp superfamily protein probably involved in dna repair [Leptolyngbya sp. Heron Island J]